MTVTDPYTGIGVITRGVFDSDMAAISLSLHSSCNDIALNEKNSPSFCQIHFYRGIFHLLSSCTLSTLRAFNSSSFHPSSPQIHPFSMIPVTPHIIIRSFNPRTPCGVRQNERQNTGTVFVCNVTANMVKIDRKMANSPLNATPLHPHCNLVAPPLKTA